MYFGGATEFCGCSVRWSCKAQSATRASARLRRISVAADFVTDGGNKLKFRDSVNTMEGCPLGLGVEVTKQKKENGAHASVF